MSLPEELIRSLGKQLAPYTRYDELALLAGVFIGFFSVLTVIY